MSRKSTSRKLNDWYAHAVCVRELAGCQNHTSRTSAKTMRLRHLRLADKHRLCQKQLLSLTQLSTKCCFWCVKSVICLVFAKCTYTNTKGTDNKVVVQSLVRRMLCVRVPVSSRPVPILSRTFISFFVFDVLVLTGLCLFWLGMQTQRRAPNSSTGCRVFSAPSRRPSAGTCRGPGTMPLYDLDTWKRLKHLRRSRSVVLSIFLFLFLCFSSSKCFRAYELAIPKLH